MASSSTLIAPIAACSNNNNRGAAVGAVVPVPKTKLPTLSFISRQHYYYNNNNNKRLGLGFGLGRHVLGGSTVNYNYNHHITRASSEEEAMTTTTTTTTIEIEKAGVKIVKNPPESKLTDLGVRSWPKWGCPPSKFPWTYSAKETCYLLKGKVKVYPDGDGSDEAVEIGAGDLVEFPKGMSCTWDVSEEVDKHYNFE